MTDPFSSLLLWFFYDALRVSWDAPAFETKTGYVIRPSPGLRVLGWAIVLLGPATSVFMIAAFKELRHDNAAQWIAGAFAIAAALLGLALVVHCRRSFIFYTARGFALRPAFGQLRHLSWASVRKIEYRNVRGRLAFHSPHCTISIGFIFRGYAAFLHQVRTSLPRGIWAAPLSRFEMALWNNPWSRRAP